MAEYTARDLRNARKWCEAAGVDDVLALSLAAKLAAERKRALRGMARWATSRERDVQREYRQCLAGPLDVNDESFSASMGAFHDCAREASRRARGCK